MFSNEFFDDESVTVVMDETAKYEDIEVHIADERVYLRQYSDKIGLFDVITMSHKMYYDILESRNHPAGLFTTKLKHYPR